MSGNHESPAKASPHEHHGAKRARHPAADSTEQLIFTFNAATGAILKIEKIDADGKRHDVPKDETVALAGKDSLHEIDAALDEAFEAGISSVLAPEGEEDVESVASDEELELRKALLAGFIGHEVRRRLRRRLAQRLILSRARAH